MFLSDLGNIFKNIIQYFGLEEPYFRVEVLEDKDWLYRYKDFFKPIEINGLIITPPWEKVDSDNKIIINPKMGFGTGHHPTTRLILENMKKDEFKDKTVIDIGCGSGILGAAALKMGAKYVAFVEIDPMAIESCKETITLNGISRNKYDIYNIDIIKDWKKLNMNIFDTALINITYDVIVDLFDFVDFKNICYFLLSGILASKENDIKNFFIKKGFDICDTKILGDWLFIKIGRK